MKSFSVLALLGLPVLASLAGCGGSSPAAIGSRTARIQDLGDLPGPTTSAYVYATAINNRGQVVGYTDGPISHAFVWQNGKLSDLGTLSGSDTSSQASAINDQGVIVGTAQLPGTIFASGEVAYSYEQACQFPIGGKPQALPVSAGDLANLPQSNSAVGINNAGQICGTAPLNDPGLQITTDLAYTLANGKLQAASPTPGGYAGSNAAGINNSGQICGTFETFSTPGDGQTGGIGGLNGGTNTAVGAASGGGTAGKAVLRPAGQNTSPPYRRIGLMNRAVGKSRSTGAGRVAATANAFYAHAFLYSKGVFTDLGGLAGMSSEASAINDAGRIVGSSFVSRDVSHAFVWRGGTMTDIGTLGGPYSHADAIAPNGDVVGAADTATVDNSGSSPVPANGTAYVSHAFIWRNGRITDLNTLLPANSGWTLQEATGINGKGQIIGFGRNSTPGTHSFLLTL